MKICINDIETQNLLKLKLKPLEKEFNCSDKCFTIENSKIDLKQNICVENCNESEYKYEYKKYCYDICPKTTFSFISNKNEYLCLDEIKEDYYYF